MSLVGFVGLGNMGAPMAHNLLKAGHTLKVFDLVDAAVRQAVSHGASAVTSAADTVRGADVFISMLPASQHVAALYTKPNASGKTLLDAIDKSTLVIDCSTIAPETARQVGSAAQQRGIAMIDAPVSGGTAGAQNATLTFIVGGEAAALERARPFLEKMGANIFHAGPSGAGQVAKICNNLLLAVQMTGTAEALALGVANGLDPAVLSEIMKRSSGGNWALNLYNPYPGVMPNVPASRNYAGGFLVDLMIKDLGLALEAADASDSPTPMGALARNLYRVLKQQHEAGRLDFSSIQKLYQKSVPKGGDSR
jgi:3-hydroxyisobutyrate dehydrogenase